MGEGHAVLNKIDRAPALIDLMFLWGMESINKVRINENYLSDTRQCSSGRAREGASLEQ